EQIENPGERLPESADAQPREHERRELPTTLAGHEHFAAGRSLRIRQHAMLLDDERPPERNHHQDAEDAAGEGEHRDLEVVEVLWAVGYEKDERRNREHNAARDRFASGANRLDDVVLED